MAEKRMISKVISISKKFNVRLEDHFSRLLYVLLIPHSDDFGRLTGDPFKIKALILPMMNDVTCDDVDQSLTKLDIAELITWYEIAGEKYIQINNFDDHQSGLHKRTRSKIPDPPRDSRNFPEIPLEGKGTELKRIETEGKGTENIPDTHKDFESLEKTHLTIFGGLTIAPVWMQYYQSIRMKGYTDGFINELLLEASETSNGKVSQRYVDTIFERWHSAGITSRKQAKESKGSSTVGRTGQASYRKEPDKKYIFRDVE